MDAMDHSVKDAAKAACVMVQAGRPAADLERRACPALRRQADVTDGPFTEAKEVVGGYAIFDAKSKADMSNGPPASWTSTRNHMPGWEGEAEIRQLARAWARSLAGRPSDPGLVTATKLGLIKRDGSCASR